MWGGEYEGTGSDHRRGPLKRADDGDGDCGSTEWPVSIIVIIIIIIIVVVGGGGGV